MAKVFLNVDHAARLNLLLILVLLLASCGKSEISATSIIQYTPIANKTASKGESQNESTPNPQVTASNRLLPRSGNDINFKRISIDQGLSQSTVYSILEDRYGFIWMGTWDGLNRFDGYGFKVYKHDPQDIYSLSNNTIWEIYEDREGILWFGTDDGLKKR